MQEELQCCVTSCDRPLDATYWNNQYTSKSTGWDLGKISPPIKQFIDTVEDKSISILIPGCGNAYEAEYLLENGFSNITLIDIAADLVEGLRQKFDTRKGIQIILGDFFELNAQFDLIIEQTFFCALPPYMRQQYVYKMFNLLKPQGKLVGLLFDRTFEQGPPFGGSKNEYVQLFKQAFLLEKIDVATNSITPRSGTELWIEFQKNTANKVNLYKFKGITCNGCMNTVTQKFAALPNVLNVSMSNNYAQVLIVSNSEISIDTLQSEIAYDAKYFLEKI